MKTVLVRYRTSAACAEQNSALVRAVFEALADSQPQGLRYASYRLADGVTFLHLATLTHEENPLLALPAFQAFQKGLSQRCVEMPFLTEVEVVGAYPPSTPENNCDRGGLP